MIDQRELLQSAGADTALPIRMARPQPRLHRRPRDGELRHDRIQVIDQHRQPLPGRKVAADSKAVLFGSMFCRSNNSVRGRSPVATSWAPMRCAAGFSTLLVSRRYPSRPIACGPIAASRFPAVRCAPIIIWTFWPPPSVLLPLYGGKP